MASTGSCPYCGSALRSDQKTCPGCGAPNPAFVQAGSRSIYNPKTIEELKQYCAERGMPLKRMRFFIDEDYTAPKAFGIYRDGGDFVVYKNKADGTRAIRYRGPNESRAVRELHQKLVDECRQRGIDPDGGRISAGKAKIRDPRAPEKGTALYVLLMVAVFFPLMIVPALLLLPLAGAGINKLIHRKERDWPEDRRRIEEPLLNTPIRMSESLRYAFHVLRYGIPTDSSLTPRERQIKNQGPKWSRLFSNIPLLIGILLAWGLVVGALVAADREQADTVSFDTGYYQIGDGRLYYHNDDLQYFNDETYSIDYNRSGIWYVTEQSGDADWTLYPERQLTGTNGKLLPNNHLRRQFLGEDWQSSFGGSDFFTSKTGKAYQRYHDACYGSFTPGYYQLEDDRLLYRSGDTYWGDWHFCPLGGEDDSARWYDEEDFIRLPDGRPMTPEDAPAFFLGSAWDSAMGGSDYESFAASQLASSYPKGYYRMKDGDVYYNNSYSWYRESGDDWIYEGSSIETDADIFDSSYTDYYLDDDWDSDWGSESYESWYDSRSSSDSSSSSWDSSDSWSSSDYDSWDSSDTDWDSDW